MAHTLEIFINPTGKSPIPVQFFGVKTKKPVISNEKVTIRIEQASGYEPDVQPVTDNPISTFKKALEVADIDTSSIRCVSVKSTSEGNDENIQVEENNHSPVYILHFSGEVNELDKQIAIGKIRKIEEERKDPRRFAILFYDNSEVPFDRENFLRDLEAAQSVVEEGQKQAFNEFEIRKLDEYVAKCKEAILVLEEKIKRQRFLKSLTWLFAPTFWVHLIVLLTSVGCVLSGIDSFLSEPFLLSPIAPILMGGVYGALHIFAIAVILGLPALLILDYIDCKDRVSSYRPDYNFLSYLADIPTRLLNWHRDCAYQFVPFYIGLAGSILLAIIVGSLGINLPILDFISHVIETGFRGLGFIPGSGMEAIAAGNLQIFTTVLFTLMPLTLGSMAMHVVRTFEEGILPSRDKEIAAANLSEDHSTLAVRFRDGLSAELSVQDDLKPKINVSKVGYSTDRLFLFDEGKESFQTKPSAELHDALMRPTGNCKVSVV